MQLLKKSNFLWYEIENQTKNVELATFAAMQMIQYDMMILNDPNHSQKKMIIRPPPVQTLHATSP